MSSKDQKNSPSNGANQALGAAPIPKRMPEPDEALAARVASQASDDGAGLPSRPGRPGEPEVARGNPYHRPGVIEIQLSDNLAPILPKLQDASLILRHLDRSIGGFGDIVRQHGVPKAAPSILIDASKVEELGRKALSRGIVVPRLDSFITLRFPLSSDTIAIAHELRQLPEIEMAVPVPLARPAVSPEPRLGSTSTKVVDPATLLENQWYVFRCGVDQAWKRASGSGVVIGDVDFGFCTTHEELKPNLEATYNACDGTNVVNAGSRLGHGTSVAALCAAAKNEKGMQGIAYEARLWLIQADGGCQDADGSPWAQGITWIILKDSGNRRKVALLEAQTAKLGNFEQLPSVNAAIQTAIHSGVVVCVAAGNGFRDAGVDDYGSKIPETGSILVGATGYDDVVNKRAWFSNYGERVTVSAPGDFDHDVTATDGSDTNYTNQFGGTSGAAAKVAAVAALMLEVNPDLTHEDVRGLLVSTGSKVEPYELDENKPVGGFLNAGAAVLAAMEKPEKAAGAFIRRRREIDPRFDKLTALYNSRGRVEVLALGKDNSIYQERRAPSGEPTWVAIGGWVDQFVVVPGVDGTLDLVARGSDKSLHHCRQLGPDGPWSIWTSLGGHVESFVAVRTVDARLEVFARGSDHRLHRKWRAHDGPEWSKWEDLEEWIDQLAVTSTSDGSVEIFATASDGSLRTTRHEDGSREAWTSLGGWFDMIGVHCDGEQVDLFGRGLDSSLYLNSRVSGHWTGWKQWSGWVDRLQVVANRGGGTDVFVRAADKKMYRRSRQRGKDWADWKVIEEDVEDLVVVDAGSQSLLSPPQPRVFDGGEKKPAEEPPRPSLMS